MKKRIFSMVLCVALVLTLLAGCGSSASSSSGGAKKYKMAYVISTVDEFLGFLRDDVQKAAEEKGVEMELLYAGEDNSKLIDCVSAAKTEGMDAGALKDIVSTANQKTVIHINVPNAYSFHRILAVESSIIKNVKDKGDRNILLQQNRVFDLDLLIRMVEECGLKVVERGSYFIKPFTHEQMQKMLDEKIINDQILDGLYKMTEHFSDYGSEIYVNATL